MIISLHVVYLKGSGKCKFNVSASDTLDAADGDIVCSRDSERELNTVTSPLSPGVIDADKFLTVELVEGNVGALSRSRVVPTDI